MLVAMTSSGRCKMSRSLWLSSIPLAIAITALLAVGLAGLQPWDGGHGHQAFAHLWDEDGDTTNDFHASLDANPWNGSGPCNPIDTLADVSAGDYEVAVCIESATAALATFEFGVSYDPALTSCTDVACPSGDCVDDNPDANAGATLGSGVPTSPSLGGGWDCNILDTVEPSWEPTCQKDGSAEAWLACWSLTGPFTTPTGDVAFPLAIVTFTTLAEGVDDLALGDIVMGDRWSTELGSCNPIHNVPISCLGATVDLCEGDVDCDGFLDGVDNCPAIYNPDQMNSDGPCRPNGSQIPGQCASNPAADNLGDVCDPDADNDSLPDSSENEASCPFRLVGDSDGDGPLDGYEVADGKNACNVASKPACSDQTNTDNDGITDCTEHSGYATCAFNGDTFPSYTACSDPIDSDGDGCADWIEIVDVDGSKQANLLDVMWIAKRMFNIIPASDSDPVLDTDKSGVVNLIDGLLAAKNSTLVKSHDPCP